MPIDCTPQPVVALIRDLLFLSKVTATARAVQRKLMVVREPSELSGQGGGLLLVDLSLPQAIEAASGWKRQHKAPVIGFASHVDSETLERARASGIDRVLTRGAFSAQLESLLKSG
ncbi:MAG: hypothetical protein RMJ35_10845 [Phycisphaerales bacterium]|nr:hypothetical protein [Phycisphaerales bacterium]